MIAREPYVCLNPAALFTLHNMPVLWNNGAAIQLGKFYGGSNL